MLRVAKIKHVLYWYFQQNHCLNIKKHAIHRLAWGPMLVGPPGNCPVCPCVKTALNKSRKHIREINYWLSLSVMTETKWCKNIQLNAPLQRKRMSVTWDDSCVIRHILKTFLCLLSVSKDTKLSHSQYI
jgi:hypothetical protein